MYVCICVGLMTTEVAFCTSCGWYEKVVKHFLFVCPMNFPLAQSNCRSHLPWSDQWRLLLTKSNWSIQGNIVPWWFIHELCCLCSLLSWSWFTPSGPACLVVVRRKCITWQRVNTNNASVFLPFHQLFCLFVTPKLYLRFFELSWQISWRVQQDSRSYLWRASCLFPTRPFAGDLNVF